MEYNEGLGSIRTKKAPKKTIKAYKLMRLVDGKLYPLFIDSSVPTEIGVWYDADSTSLDSLRDKEAGFYYLMSNEGDVIRKQAKKPTKTEVEDVTKMGFRYMYVKQAESKQRRYGGYKQYYNVGINGSGVVSPTYAIRPGWHAGSLPTMRQIGKGSNKDKRDDSFVWTEVELSADVDYNPEAQRNPDKDIPDHIPEDGYYMKATNADKKKSQADLVGWYVAGAMKINRIISDKEARQIIDRFNAKHPGQKKVEYDYDRESGKEFDAGKMMLEGISSVLSGLGMSVHHNSPYLLKRADGSFVDPESGERLGFDHRFMSSGEGHQVHGWGSYFSVEDLKKYGENKRVRKDVYYVKYKGILYSDKDKVGEKYVIAYDLIQKEGTTSKAKSEAKRFKDKAVDNEVESFWDDVIGILSNSKKSDFKKAEGGHHYHVEIPDNDGIIYLEEEEPLKEEQIEMIKSQARKENKKDIVTMMSYAESHPYKFSLFRSSFVDYPSRYNMTPEEFSKFLSRAGFVGIHYYGNQDGECYVIFNENDAKIVGHDLFGVENTKREGEGLGFASFHISKNEDEFFANIDEAIEKNGVVREDVCDLCFPILSLLPMKFNHKGNLLSLIRKIAEEKNIIGSHKVLVGDSIGIVNISNKFFKKALSEKATTKSYNKELQYVSSLNIIEILNNSLDIEIHPNVLKVDGDRKFFKSNINKYTLIHRLFSAINFDGDYYRIKITIKENYKQNNTIYTVENMKIELLPPSKGMPREHLVTSNSIPSAILLKGVEKSYEKGIFLLDCCKKTHTKTIGSTDATSLTPSQQFQNRRQARASQLKKGDKITYTEDDFFRVECDDLKRVHEAIMYWKEIFSKKSNEWLDDLLLDDKGYPIYTYLEQAEIFIASYNLYKDEWKKDFIFGDRLSSNDPVKSWVMNNHIGKGADENVYKEITKVHHKPSLLLIYEWIKKSIIRRDDEEYEKYANSYLEKIKKYIDSIKDDELIDKMVNAHKRAFSDNVTIPKQITLADCYKYCGTDENKPYYTGIYHDPKGFAVVTNGQILYAHNNLYESKSKGNIIDKSGKVIDSNFPDWQAVVNRYANNTKILTPIDIDRDDLYRKLYMYERKFKYRKHHNPYQPFAITDGDKTYFFESKLLMGVIIMSYAHKDVKFSLSQTTFQGKEEEGSAPARRGLRGG